MVLIPIKAILWRRLQQANYDSLGGISTGQYDIRLGRDDTFEDFFEGIAHLAPTALGGYDLSVPIAAFDGPSPVQATELRVRFMGSQSQRRDWNIPSQRPETAYPLWRLGRANPNQAEENYIVLIRDVTGQFHARWLNAAAMDALPPNISQALRAKNFGVYSLTAAQTGTEASRIADKLRTDHNILLYGPPGTGKSQLMWEVAKAFTQDPPQVDTLDEQSSVKGGAATQTPIVRWVTFHQSYGYEDFVVGLRPDPASDKALSLKAFPGVLLELAEHARTTGRPGLLLVDEINRGNVSRIFGEFITLLEPDKRLGKDGNLTGTTVSLTLPYVDENTSVPVDGTDRRVPNPFTMPANVYLLASMNSVDRSVAPLDAALRRRFRIVNLDPDIASLRNAFAIKAAVGTEAEVAEIDRLREVASDLLVYLNDGISAFRGPDYQLGQWYFADMLKASNLTETQAALVSIWNEKLQPHLEDVFHGRSEQLSALIGNDSPIELSEPPSHYESVGARPFFRRRDLSPSDILSFLSALIESESALAETGGQVGAEINAATNV